MRREDIPWRLAAARGKDLARIPLATMAAMAACDLAPRLLAHDAMIRKARVPHLDHDLYRLRIRMATDALTETDPRAVAAIMKAAGVAWSGHDPMVGRHTHAHPAFGSRGSDATHEHEHSHDGDANHRHRHAGASAKSAKSAAQIAADAVRAAASPPPGRPRPALARSAAPGPVRKAPEPASAATVWAELAEASPEPVQAATYRQMARDARERSASGADHLSKAADYEAKAARVSSGEDRGTYLELAREERQKARA
jgi:hypothetical protein